MNYELASKVTEFLVERTDTCLGYWAGKMTKKEQIDLFGYYFGKGLIVISGANEIIEHKTKVCFGTDTETTKICSFTGKLFDNTTCQELSI